VNHGNFLRTALGLGLAAALVLAAPARAQQPIVIEFSHVVAIDTQKATWKKAMAPVHKENPSRVCKDTLEAVYKQASHTS